MSVFELSGRKALVTGAAQGLGEGMARALAAAGARVMIADVQDGSAVAESLGEGHAATILDVTDDSAWEAAVAHTVETRVEAAFSLFGGGERVGERQRGGFDHRVGDTLCAADNSAESETRENVLHCFRETRARQM